MKDFIDNANFEGFDGSNSHKEELLLNDYYTVGVRFASPDLSRDRPGQSYTYKVDKRMSIEVEDFVVVFVRDEYKVVYVHRVDEIPRLDFDAPYSYNYVVQRVNLELFNELKERSKKLSLLLADLDRRQLKKNLTQEFSEVLTDSQKEILQLECGISFENK